MPRVVLDRRDVVDRLAQAAGLGIDQPVERPALDVDEVGDVQRLVQARERAAHPRGVNNGQGGDSSEGRKRAKRKRVRATCREARNATIQDTTGASGTLGRAIDAHGPRPASPAYVARARPADGCDYRSTAAV